MASQGGLNVGPGIEAAESNGRFMSKRVQATFNLMSLSEWNTAYRYVVCSGCYQHKSSMRR